MPRIPFCAVAGAAALFVALLGLTGCSFGESSRVDDAVASQRYKDADDVLEDADDLREDFKNGDVDLDESTKGANITLLG